MSLITKNYVKVKKNFYRTVPVDFTRVLKSYKNLLIHPVMEPGREVFCLAAVESIIRYKGEENVALLVNEKLKFFFKNINSKKIYYRDFSSPFSSHYKTLKKNIRIREYDIFVDLNRYYDEVISLIAMITRSKVRICLDGSVNNPVFNMVITGTESNSEVERNNSILKLLGVKRVKKRINWKIGTSRRGRKKNIGIGVRNLKVALRLFSILKEWNFKPFLFVNERKKVDGLQKRIGESVLPVCELDKVYNECASCSSIITSINPVLSIGFLQKKRVLLFLEEKKKFNPPEGQKIEVCSLHQVRKLFNKRIKEFAEG